MRARDRVAVAAVRSALAAIDNAEAVDVAPAAARSLSIEQSAVGLGAAEVARRHLTEADLAAIIRGEIGEREDAAFQMEQAGRADRAEQLRAEASVLRGYLGD